MTRWYIRSNAQLFPRYIYIFFSSLSPDRRYERISHEKFIERVNYRNNRSAESVIIPGVQLIVADSDRWVIMSLIHSSSTWLSWNSGFHSGQILSQLRDDEWFFRIVFTILIIKGVSWNLHARIKKKVTSTCLFQFFLSFFFFRCIYFWIFFFFSFLTNAKFKVIFRLFHSEWKIQRTDSKQYF